MQSCMVSMCRETDIGEYIVRFWFLVHVAYQGDTSSDQSRGLRSLTCVPSPLSGATVIMPWRVVSSVNCDRP